LTSLIAGAEAIAGGGVPSFLYGDLATNATKSGFGPCFEAAASFANFTRHQRQLFAADRTKLAEVALLYSIPSMMWRQDSSLNVPWGWDGMPRLDAFASLARVLEDAHLPYDVLLLDHPSVSKFMHMEQRLVHFKVIVLPAVDALSDTHAVRIAEWVKAGGVAVAADWNSTGIFDEDLKPRIGGTPAVLRDLLLSPGHGELRIVSAETMKQFILSESQAAKSEITGKLVTSTANIPPLLTFSGLPSTVWVNAWRHGGGPMRSITLVNYDGNATLNLLRPVADPFSLSLRCDDLQDQVSSSCQDISNATLIVLENVRGAPSYHIHQLEVSKEQKLGHMIMKVTVPGGAITSALGVVVFSAPAELSARSAAGEARKMLERLRIAARSHGLNRRDYTSQLDGASQELQTLQARHSQVPPHSFQALASRMHALAASLRQALNNVTSSASNGQKQQRAAVLKAVAPLLLSAGDSGGTAKPPSGWLQLGSQQKYSPKTHYGWVKMSAAVTAKLSPEAGSLDGVHSETLSSISNATLRLDIPGNLGVPRYVTLVLGSYDVSRTSSTSEAHISPVGLQPECPTVALPGKPMLAGLFQHRSFQIGSGCNGSIFIEFSSPGFGPFYGDGYQQGIANAAWMLAGIVAGSTSPPTLEAASYALVATELAVGACLDFAVLGPFLDANFTGRQQKFGPDGGAVDYNVTYDSGLSTRIGWTRRSLAPTSESPASLVLPFIEPGAVSFAVTYIYIPLLERSQDFQEDATVAAMIVTSFGSVGSIAVNGDIVVEDRVANGLQLAEVTAVVNLIRGAWNEVRARTLLPSWGTDARFSLSTKALDGKGLPGVKTSACPPSHAYSMLCRPESPGSATLVFV